MVDSPGDERGTPKGTPAFECGRPAVARRGEPAMALPSFRLDDRVALVTGAGSGIGREIAIGLAEAGADVACVDLPSSDLPAPAAAIGAIGRRAAAAPADVTDEAAVAAAVDAAE